MHKIANAPASSSLLRMMMMVIVTVLFFLVIVEMKERKKEIKKCGKEGGSSEAGYCFNCSVILKEDKSMQMGEREYGN